MTKKLGRDLAVDDLVRVIRPWSGTELDIEDWGDSAVVLDNVACGCDGDCRIVKVAEDTFPGTRTTIHARGGTAYSLHPPID
jgi:hypothetical protein